MSNCTNDFTPVILALAAQIPILVGALVAWLKYGANASHSKERQYKIIAQGDKLLYIIENGFHGPPGLTGARGEPGPAGATGQAGQAGQDYFGRPGPARAGLAGQDQVKEEITS